MAATMCTFRLGHRYGFICRRNGAQGVSARRTLDAAVTIMVPSECHSEVIRMVPVALVEGAARTKTIPVPLSILKSQVCVPNGAKWDCNGNGNVPI